MTLTTKSIRLSDQMRLEYVEHGRPGGVPVLFLHGLTDSWRSFERVLPHLPDTVHAVALSQRGHGDSDRPASGYRPAELAADAAAFLDALGLERAVIAGHSMGGHVARRFALDDPERTLGLVLMGSFFTCAGNAAMTELWEAVSVLADPVDRGFALDFQRGTIAKGVPEAYLETVVAESLKVPARVWRAALAGQIEEDHSAELAEITAPTLVVWGERDAFVPRRDQDALVAAIARARLVVYPGAGHGLHWDDPERFAADLSDFCARPAWQRPHGRHARRALA